MQRYTYSQVLEASTKYFNGDDFAAKVFVDKYALQNLDGEYLELTPSDMHHRLAKEFARIEKKYPNPMEETEIFNLLDKFKYIVPQGSPMFGIGNNFYTQSLGNCFVVNSPYDSYGGILHTDQELTQLMKRRCGVGTDISNIRPKGMPTKNAAKTTDGIGIFMERFSNTTREVAQSGRRGALMLSISINHPEIETFINIKKNLQKVTGANISIRITNEFMKAVIDDKDYTLRFPTDKTIKDAKITKIVKAKNIWNQIIEAAWTSAEPGVLFWDHIIDNSPADIYASKYDNFRTQSTNPCQPAWATLLTEQGIKTFSQVSVGDIIWSGKKWTKIINKICTGEKDIYAFKTRAGTFYGTDNHRIISNGEKIEVKDAESIDISNCLAIRNMTDVNDLINFSLIDKEESNEFKINTIDGLVIGDGMVHKASNNKVVLLIGKDDQDYFSSEISALIIENCAGIKDIAWQVATKITNTELPKTYNRKIPDRYKFGDFNKRRAFLRGLYSANGSIVSNRITLKSSSFQIIEDVQQMLSSLGITSYYTVNKSHEVEFDNGTYECKQNYDLNIGTLHGRQLFDKYIGFIHSYKNKKVKQILNTKQSFKAEKNTYDIVEKEYLGKELVYDITVEAEEHTYWTGGLCVSNCGELPLGLDSCRLLLTNLVSFVDYPYTQKAEFNFTKFSEIVQKSQRLMDDLIDLEIEKINNIITKIQNDPEPDLIKQIEINMWKQFLQSCEQGRRTGTGITSLGDCLAALGIKYGSKESIKMTELIYKTLAINAYKSSCILAGERGAFPIFDKKMENGHPYISLLMNDVELKKLYEKNGRRNISILTTAPTGSVSTLTQTTSGIEPAYLLSYVRRKKINPSDTEAKVDFTDNLGDRWQEFNIYHHGVKNWMEITGEKDITKSPYYGATSNEVDWEASVDIQAVAQKWIDHSISKTCNLPETATKDLVSQVYLRAWEKGCKGFTVYRDKCRDGVLIQKPDAKKILDGRPTEIENILSPKRPLELFCDIKKVKVQGEQWTIFVGLFNGKPYEIFGGLSKYIDIPNKIKTGKIVKNGKVDGITTYNLVSGEGDDQLFIKDVASVFENANFGALTRTISLALRHGTPVQYIAEQLQKDKHSDITSFSKVIARVIKGYISDGTTSTAERQCPSCKKENSFAYQEKCLTCMSCGYSKCN